MQVIMRLGFYYHIPFALHDNKIAVPGYLGIFVDALAVKVEKLTFIGNQTKFDPKEHDYVLTSGNIEYIDLGPKSHAFCRAFFGNISLMKFRNRILDSCDIILVRGPSPMAPHFKSVFGKKLTVAYLVVGDYSEGSKQLSFFNFKNILLKLFYFYTDTALSRAIKGSVTFTNSYKLKKRYVNLAGTIKLISTSTLRSEDYFERSNTCLDVIKTILFVGRFDFTKGIRELLEAFIILTNSRDDVCLKLVGWVDSRNQGVIDYMKNFIFQKKLSDKIFIMGRAKYGTELNNLYRTSDIFVLPSHHEGMPRVIYEAMANSLPVIATKVGSIPYNLVDGVDSVLVEPKTVAALVDALELVLENKELRKSIIFNGFIKAKELVLDKQVSIIVNAL